MMGRVIMSGIVPPLVAPVTGILASDLAVGSVVKLMEDGVATEYLVVNQGKPSGSSLYDDSCDGTWLFRKNYYLKKQWHSSKKNDYKNSTMHSYLNDTFFNVFGEKEKNAIKHVKIPYVNGYGSSGVVSSGVNGLTAKVFLLAGYEIGFTTTSVNTMPIDGTVLDYFVNTSSDPNTTEPKRIFNDNVSWWTRSPNKNGNAVVFICTANGSLGTSIASSAGSAIYPTIILPSTAVFDETTMLLKGVK